MPPNSACVLSALAHGRLGEDRLAQSAAPRDREQDVVETQYHACVYIYIHIIIIIMITIISL